MVSGVFFNYNMIMKMSLDINFWKLYSFGFWFKFLIHLELILVFMVYKYLFTEIWTHTCCFLYFFIFLLYLWPSILHHFLSASSTSTEISFRGSLLVKCSLQFLFFVNVFIVLSFMKDILCWLHNFKMIATFSWYIIPLSFAFHCCW